jgi:hypothetical protein
MFVIVRCGWENRLNKPILWIASPCLFAIVHPGLLHRCCT